MEKATLEAREAVLLGPDDSATYGNLGSDYMDLNRLDEAENV
jgi:Flp pilus assembly protein TadD